MNNGSISLKSRWIPLAGLGLCLALLSACAKSTFTSVPKLSCSNGEDRDSECVQGKRFNTYSFSFRSGEVDILFVNDNSGSMYVEQAKMATAFPNFFSRISSLFYQIAMVTTDTTGNQAPFLTFKSGSGVSSGLNVINERTANVNDLFLGTVKRNETLVCDQNGFNPSFCPSGDERGLYAASLAVQNGPGSFFRTGAHLAIVVLSDEDERSTGGRTLGYELETVDTPQNLLRTLESKYPTKSVSVHSVIVKPGDSACLTAQRQVPTVGFPTLGRYGTLYAAISKPATYAAGAGITEDLFSIGNLVDGDVGSICQSDFTVQMGDIGRNVRANSMQAPKKLSCVAPATFTVTTIPSGMESQITSTIDAQGRVTFANVPIGVEVRVSYECDRFQ
jgi:hypothetical protein